MATRIMGLHETVVPKHFTRRMSAQVRYGTYTVEQINRHEAMRADLNANRPLSAEGKPASMEDKLALTEYCVMNEPMDLIRAFEANKSTELLEMKYKIEDGGYSPSGRSLGRNFGEGPTAEYWHFDSLIPARFREGFRILELGAGTTRAALNHAKYHKDHFVVTLEAHAPNIREVYVHLDGQGFVTNTVPNLRILFGDIRFMEPPEDFRADLLLANWVFYTQHDKDDKAKPKDEDVEMFEAFLKWSKPDCVIRLSPPLGDTAMHHHLLNVMKRPDNTGRKLFFGIK